MSTNLRYENGSWYSGCGCGGKAKVKITTPESSVAILIQKQGLITGPVTGIKYNVHPSEVSIDIDIQDAEYWIANGIAKNHNEHTRGRETRVV